ncbi:MAG: PEGA domain-containing protein [Sideroxydans sp.]|nr:PEGA domain-containing protein [Sideroxydans sp.]
MEERSKTIMCSVLFLDIVEYSKKSVSGQISLKERFNAFLSVAIRDVPLDDRIILDTGDGAALSFLGDVEDALQVALSLRESLRSEGAHMEPALLVRMGINLGPVRLVKDINGQPNIVGDGINVAQRIMAFSDPGQILVSRSYYDAVSRLSSEYAGMFHYQGSRTDKHVREHEVYAIGYPGEFTAQQPTTREPRKPLVNWGELKQGLVKSWQGGAQSLGKSLRLAGQQMSETVQMLVAYVRKATPRQRVAYGSGLAAVVAAIVLLEILVHRPSAESVNAAGDAPAGQQMQMAAADSAQAPAAKTEASGDEAKKKPVETAKKPVVSQKKTVESKTATDKNSRKLPDSKSSKSAKPETKATTGSSTTNIFGIPIPAKGKPGFVSVSCMEGSTVFVDGFTKGVVGKKPLTISLDPGKHQLNITHTSKTSVYTESITVKSGETIRLNPGFCN